MIQSLFIKFDYSTPLDKTANFFLWPLHNLVDLIKPVKVYHSDKRVYEIPQKKDSLILKIIKVAISVLIVIPFSLLGLPLKALALLDEDMIMKHDLVESYYGKTAPRDHAMQVLYNKLNPQTRIDEPEWRRGPPVLQGG